MNRTVVSPPLDSSLYPVHLVRARIEECEGDDLQWNGVARIVTASSVDGRDPSVRLKQFLNDVLALAVEERGR